MGLPEGYGRFVTGDLVLTRGSKGAPAPPDVEALYRDASRDAPLGEPPEVATMFARLYGELLARRAAASLPQREARRPARVRGGRPGDREGQQEPGGGRPPEGPPG